MTTPTITSMSNKRQVRPPKTNILSLYHLIKHPIDFLINARHTHGDIYQLNAGIKKIVALNHPRHIQHVFVNHSNIYRRDGDVYELLRAYTGNGLLTTEGDFWLRQRRMMQPHFHRKRIAALTDLMIQAIDEGLDRWENASRTSTPINIVDEIKYMTMKVIVKTMFGTGLNQAEADQAGELLSFIIDYIPKGALIGSLPGSHLLSQHNRFLDAIKQVDDILYKVIDRARSSEEASLIAMLLGMVDAETGSSMTDTQLRDEAINIFTAGYETTSVALTWAIYLLHQHNHIGQTLQEEIDTVLTNEMPTLAYVRQLPYLEKVIKEVLRYRSPAWFIPRIASEDDEIDGFFIPAGTQIFVMPYGVHHHPDIWPNPHQFDPTRFEQSPSNFSWIPFGAGQHKCIGGDFALLEAQLLLAMLIQRYKITPTTEAKTHLSLTICPANFYASLERR